MASKELWCLSLHRHVCFDHVAISTPNQGRLPPENGIGGAGFVPPLGATYAVSRGLPASPTYPYLAGLGLVPLPPRPGYRLESGNLFRVHGAILRGFRPAHSFNLANHAPSFFASAFGKPTSI